MTTTIEPADVDLDVQLDDVLTVDPWEHSEPIAEPEPTPAPEPVDDGLTPALRTMVDELDRLYHGNDVASISTLMVWMKEATGNKSWDSRGQVDKARKAYRAKHGIQTEPPAATKPARTKPPKQARTAPVRPKPTLPVPPVVRADPEPVVQVPVPSPPSVVQPEPVPQPQPVVRTAPVRRQGGVWPLIISLPAMVAIWGGWVGLGKLTGFGEVNLLPGIVAEGGWSTIDSAITLPVGMEAYAAFALRVWLSGQVPTQARTFARWSAFGSLAVGSLGQVAYHQLVAAGVTAAPWWITTIVACLPVGVLGMAAALYHLVNATEEH